MKISGLLSRSGRELPGVMGLAKVDRCADALARRVGCGDIAVFDQVDLDRRTADALVAAGVTAVVNAAPSISGRFPNLGPEILISAGIVLIDGAGPAALRIKEGSRLRLHEGAVYIGDTEVTRGIEQDANSIADLMIEAKSGLSAQLEAFSANTIEFLRHERALIIDRVGVPEINVPLRGRQVLVVAPGHNHIEDLAGLKHFIREYRPVLIGVEAGADALRAAGHRPHLIVGDPHQVGTDTLKSAAEVVVPAQPDGFAPGLGRIQDLGIGAVTFPSVSNPEDLALLLAEAHGAELVIAVGFHATLHEFLDRGRSGSNPSTFLTRLRLGNKLIDGHAAAAMYRSRVSVSAVLLMVIAALVAVATAVLVSGVGGVMSALAGDLWDAGTHIVTWVKGLG
ncbi:MAG TPA: putative cytokinetic ring protein SteA [Pseudonocardiaceae bacterium]|nr:putative cytokinetic ring protein SteA [Pseudonocardiaceae bacterium]